MKIVPDWREAWRWISMNCFVAATALQGAWMSLNDDERAIFPHDIVHVITIGILVLGIVGRLVKQGNS